MTEYYTAEKSKERMKIIKTYYLIDYENVGSEGFKGCEKLRETDIIHLFYTDNSRKIDLDIINDHGESKLITCFTSAIRRSIPSAKIQMVNSVQSVQHPVPQ